MIKERLDDYFQLNFLQEYLWGHNGFIAGGCFKHILNNERIKDIDIFFRSKMDYEEAVIYFDEKTAGYNRGYEDTLSVEDAEYIFVYQNDKCKCYKHKKNNIKIELCRSIFGTPKEVISQFDFTITKMALSIEDVSSTDEESKFITVSQEAIITRHEDFFKHLFLKRLVIDDGIPYPMSTLDRTYRYARYGYFPCRESKIKLAVAIHSLPINKIDVNESLYDGVD